MSEVKYAMSIIRGKLKNADEHNLHYQRFSIADMEAILGVLSKSESDYAALQQKLDALAAESDTNLRGAASELNTSWMFHKTMMAGWQSFRWPGIFFLPKNGWKAPLTKRLLKCLTI